MQNRVFDTADILVDRKPLTCSFVIKRTVIRTTTSKAGEIPRAINKCVQRIRFAGRRFSAAWALYMFPCCVAVEGIARNIKADIIWKLYR